MVSRLESVQEHASKGSKFHTKHADPLPVSPVPVVPEVPVVPPVVLVVPAGLDPLTLCRPVPSLRSSPLYPDFPAPPVSMDPNDPNDPLDPNDPNDPNDPLDLIDPLDPLDPLEGGGLGVCGEGGSMRRRESERKTDW